MDVGLVTYSVRPRGGVVHLLSLAEALVHRGVAVEIVALGDADHGFFRAVDAPCHFVAPPPDRATLEERVFAAVDALADGLRQMGPALPPILHVQDCIAARACVRIRDEGAPIKVLRTVHHVDDFTTPALVECQRRSILDPDRVLVVSEAWKRQLLDDYAIAADVVTNGVDVERFAAVPDDDVLAGLRDQVGATDRFLILTAGGIEPRKGTDHLFRAMSLLRQRLDKPPVLAIIGGHSFQDHAEYRRRVIATMPALGLEFDGDVVMLGTLPDDEMPRWYHAADVFAFPSVTEGWGLVVLEAMAAGTPTVLSDLAVFGEYLAFGRDCLASPSGDDEALAGNLERVATDATLRTKLIAAGRAVAARHTWSATAAQHVSIYDQMVQGRSNDRQILEPRR